MEDPKPLTLDEYLAWESEQKEAHELIDRAIVTMPGPTRRHAFLFHRLRDMVRDSIDRNQCDVLFGRMTASVDLGPKVRSYFAVPALLEYRCVDSWERFVVLRRRQADAIVEMWPIGAVNLVSIPIAIPMGVRYAGLFAT